MPHAEKLLAILAEEDRRQAHITEIRQKPAHTALRDALEKAEDQIERAAALRRIAAAIPLPDTGGG